MEWLTQNLATIIISIFLLLVVFFIIRHLVLQKKGGKSACGCNCKGCSLADGGCQTMHSRK